MASHGRLALWIPTLRENIFLYEHYRYGRATSGNYEKYILINGKKYSHDQSENRTSDTGIKA
jgi:hypothetical protein